MDLDSDIRSRLSPEFLLRFRIERILGQGGMGVVVLAQDTALSRPVAVKLLFTTSKNAATVAVKRLEREARVLSQLGHGSLARVFDLGVDGPATYMVSEYVPGDTVEQLVEREGPLTASRVTGIALDVLAGLEALHAEGIVHRDIKPGNLIVTPAGVRIIDLGIARVAQTLEELTRTGHAVGTPAFMAPEQATDSSVGPAADLYSLGAVLHNCLTRAYVFEGSALQIVALKVNRDPPSIGSVVKVPAPLAAAIDRLLARDPAARPRTAAEARRLFTASTGRVTARKLTPVSARQAAGPSPSPRGVRPGRIVVAVAATAVLVAALALVRPGPGRPLLSDLVVEQRPDSVTVRFRRTPPGEASLLVRRTGRPDRFQGTTARGVTHEAVLGRLAEGDLVTVQPVAGGAQGPVASFRFQPPRAREASLTWGPDAVTVGFETVLPSIARVRVRSRAGARWTHWEARPATSHGATIPLTESPISTDLPVELKGSDGSVVTDRLVLPEAQRLAYLGHAGDWFVDSAERARQRLLERGQAAETGKAQLTDVHRELVRACETLGPEWFLREVGGTGALLDHPAIGPERKDRFYRAVWVAETVDGICQQYRLPGTYPFQLLYGSHFGPSASRRYPRAATIPIELEGVDTSARFEIVPSPGYINETDLTGRRDCFHEIRGTLELPPLTAGSRVELHARARFLPARAIQALINGRYAVRLSRPDRAFPMDRAADVYTAFDPRYLRDGKNAIRFSCPVMLGIAEELEVVHGVRVEPPGFSLRVEL
ncbi:MAG: serine/threonine protein kinase [Candidatus Riflebacteria bacterium]|nr:serine/threonine protein kinase [Candidatus Riflebacteria bacterium]